MLKQSLLQKKAKALLILLAVTMGASVVSALLNVQTDLRTRMNRELRDYGPNVVVLPEANRTYISQEFLKHIESAGISGKVIAFTPQLFVGVRISNIPAILVGADLSSYRKLYPSQEWTGTAGAPGSNSIFVGKRLAGKLNVAPKSKVSVTSAAHEMQFDVAGFVESGESEDDELFVDLAAAQQLSGTGPQFQSILFSVLGNLQEVQTQFGTIVGKHQGVTFQVIRKIAATESLFLDKISRLVGLVILLIFVILFFCIHTTVSTVLISRQAEIALLRVLGARRKEIASALTSELLLLGLLGGACGYAVGVLMAQVLGKVLFHAFITPSFLIFLITLFFSLFLMVVSSFFPISRAVNRQAALVLKEA